MATNTAQRLTVTAREVVDRAFDPSGWELVAFTLANRSVVAVLRRR